MNHRAAKKVIGAMLVAGFAGVMHAAGAQPATAQTNDLRQEVEALKREVSDLRKALDEIRQAAPQAGPPARAAAPAVPVKVSVANRPSMGRADAPVTLVEFSDYQCPFCRRHVTSTLPELKRDYVDRGKVRYVYRDFPIDRLHPEARKAAEAAHCAGDQGKYWEMHDLLFARQRQLNADDLKKYASGIGVDQAAFNACLDEGRHAKVVDEDERAGASIGVTGTPTFVVGKTRPDGTLEGVRLVGAQPASAFRRAIDALLAE